MAWVRPKVLWYSDDYINYTDYNRIKNDVEALHDSFTISRNDNYQALTHPANHGMEIYVRPEEKDNYILFILSFYRSGEEEPIYSNTYKVHGEGYHNIASDVPYVDEEMLMARGSLIITRYDYYFPIEDMGEDKAVNDLWYADEVNTILDNLDLIAREIGMAFNKPYYFPNGNTPNNVELGYIEHKLLLIYNRINGQSEALYLGQGGYLGTRIQNRLL